jgi:peptidoglycan/LPS O-acetylase OafA/YrhL
MSSASYYYKGLNGLRAFSVFLVIASHLKSLEFLTKVHLRCLWTILSGNAGVNLFFLISGFLITEILIRQKKSKKLSIKNFIFRRILRIFPYTTCFY